jgi:hypothetical protein
MNRQEIATGVQKEYQRLIADASKDVAAGAARSLEGYFYGIMAQDFGERVAAAVQSIARDAAERNK